jgi:hypothetical protein
MVFDRLRRRLEGSGVGDIKQVRDTVVVEVDRDAKSTANVNNTSAKMESWGFEEERRVSGLNSERVPRDKTLVAFSLEPEEVDRKLRPAEARASDRGKDAEVTTNAAEWASDPSRHDYPGVDTGPRFEETFDDDFADFDDSDFSF